MSLLSALCCLILSFIGWVIPGGVSALQRIWGKKESQAADLAQMLFVLVEHRASSYLLHPQVHGILRRSSSFNTGRIEHLYQNPQAHTEGSKCLFCSFLHELSNHNEVVKCLAKPITSTRLLPRSVEPRLETWGWPHAPFTYPSQKTVVAFWLSGAALLLHDLDDMLFVTE